MKNLITALLMLALCNVFAQVEECGVKDNKKYNLPKDFKRQVTDAGTRQVPVSIWIVNKADGSGGINIGTIYNELEITNQAYRGRLNFTVCQVNYINSDEYYNLKNTGLRMATDNFNTGNVNIYFVNSLTIGGSSYCGYAYYPAPDKQRILMRNSCTDNGSTLAHELGHFFGFYHTHKDSDKSYQELVDGSNCSSAGDNFCSTPADPKLSTSNVNTNCEYTGTAKDLQGDSYRPSSKNLMSYSRKACRVELTDEQLTYAQAIYDFYYSDFTCESLSIKQAHFKSSNELLQFYDGVEYKLYDVSGKLILSGSEELNTNSLPAGLYFLLTTLNNSRQVTKIIL